MTKITIKSPSIAPPDLLLKALLILPSTAVIAFRTEEGLLYIRDAHADVALSHLTQAGISAEVVQRLRG
jgi:hypothetical protein